MKTVQEGHLYDVQPSHTHINEYPNMVLIPTIYKVDSPCAATVPCVLINLATGDICLTKGKMLGFLVEMDIELNKRTPTTVCDIMETKKEKKNPKIRISLHP